MQSNRFLGVTLILGLLMTLLPATTSAAPNLSSPSQPPEPGCNPMALRLSAWMDVGCSRIMGYQAQGVGFGVIMKAYYLSQTFPDLQWERLVSQHMSEEGWGQIMKAHALAARLGLDPDELLAGRAEGKGWGEILQEYREGPGKPPWAAQGPPPWAKGRGKPSWAGPHRPNE